MATKTKARLAKEERYKLTLNEELVEFYRKYPHIAMEDLFGIKLVWLQRIALYELWHKESVLMIMTRGLSKSSILIWYACLKAILYPGIKIGLISKSYRQVRRFMFPEIRRLQKESKYFARCVDGKINMGQEGCIINFKSGSFIEGLPPGNDGDNIRGRRYEVAIVDEYGFMDPTLISTVIAPMLSVEKYGIKNTIHYATTPNYKWKPIWPIYLKHIKLCQDHPDKYGLVEFDHRDLNETPTSKLMPELPFKISESMIATIRDSLATDEQFIMEMMARFPDESSSYFSSRLIDHCSPTSTPGPVTIELSGNTKELYGIAVDTARLKDNFAIAVAKYVDGRVLIVNITTLNKATYQEMHKATRLMINRFPNVSFVAIGEGGGGLALKDLLASKWKNPTTGEEEDRILDVEDERHKLMPGRRLVHMIKETGQINNFIYTTIKSDMEHQRFLFPSPHYYDDGTASNSVKKVINEIIATQGEFLKLEATPTAYGHKFDPPTEKDRKDRATVCALVNYMFSEKFKEVKKKRMQATVGFWVN